MNNIEILDINDFKVILNHDKNSKTTKVVSYISHGFINETKENTGISHLLEHIVTEGWNKCSKKGCSDYWKKKGVLTNASTGQTNVKYYMLGLSKYSKEIIDYIISISLNPILTTSRMVKEKKAVQNELMIHAASSQMPLYNLLNGMLFRVEGLIYQDNMKLQLNNLKNISLSDLNDWSKRFYGLGNIILIISGKFSKNQVIKTLKKRLKKAHHIKIIPKYTDIFKNGLDIQFIKNDQIDNTNIIFAFHAPIYQKESEIFYIDFFKEFIGSGVTSMIMAELREKKNWIYNVNLDNYTNPYGTYLTIEISTKNKHIVNVVKSTIKILKKLTNGKFKNEYLEYVKQAYMVDHYATCLNNDYISEFYGQQFINQIYNVREIPNILSFKQVAEKILKLKKINFVLFIKKLLIFSNMKIAYQGKKEVKNLRSLVLKRI